VVQTTDCANIDNISINIMM